MGGNTLVKMSDLKTVFEETDCTEVTTVINSGNVIFTSSEKNEEKLTKKLEAAISKRFDFECSLVLCTDTELKEVLRDCPFQFAPAKEYRIYVAFVKSPTTPTEVAEETQLTKEVDFLKLGKRVVYMSTKNSGLMKSGFRKLIGSKIYKQLTMRNSTTVKRILPLMEI